jgi:cytochrome c-type biogenesis protein CcmH/NrfG
MKKETVILMVVIAFLVGFITGATVAILRGTKGVEKAAIVQKPQMALPGAAAPALPAPALPAPAPPVRDSVEVASQIQTLKEIVKKDPKNLPAWVELGNLYFDSDRPREAIEAYRQYLAIKPDNPDVRTDMGIMYRKLGQFDRALEEFRKAAQSDPKHINSRYNIGLVLLHDKQNITAAIKAWEEYLKVDPNSERAQRIRAQIEKMKAMSAPTK